MLARLSKNPHRGRTCPNQIAHRLMRRVRHPDRRQLACPMQLGQHHRIAAIRLHTVARLHRNERWCDHDAVMPHLDKLPVQTVAARPSLIAETQPASARSQLFHQLTDMIRAVRHRPQMPDLPAALSHRNRD